MADPIISVLYCDPVTREGRSTATGPRSRVTRDPNHVVLSEPLVGEPAAWRATEDWKGLEVNTNRPLLPLKEASVKQVNQTIGDLRGRYATDIPFQDGVYLSKLEEARTYMARLVPPATLNDFPLIAAEIGITGETADQVAQVWINMNALWMQALAQLESLRLSTVNEIQQATSVAEVDTALSNFQAAVDAL